MPKCPGQDTQFWTADDIYDVDCPACGTPVEFFRTDPVRRCDGCGYQMPNPRLDLACAQWCPQAELCVGIRLAGAAGPGGPWGEGGEGGSVHLVDRLLVATRDRLGRDRPRILRSLTALQVARELLKAGGADPRVVLAAAVLEDRDELEPGPGPAQPGPDTARQPLPRETLRQIMEEAGFEEETIRRVCGLLHGDAEEQDTPEARLLGEVAEQLAAQPDPAPAVVSP